jgi:hypothetical protein
MMSDLFLGIVSFTLILVPLGMLILVLLMSNPKVVVAAEMVVVAVVVGMKASTAAAVEVGVAHSEAVEAEGAAITKVEASTEVEENTKAEVVEAEEVAGEKTFPPKSTMQVAEAAGQVAEEDEELGREPPEPISTWPQPPQTQ